MTEHIEDVHTEPIRLGGRTDADQRQHHEGADAAITWLETQFPEWSFELGVARTWSADDATLWVATREGHHPQAELSPGKLYSRLEDYLNREAARGRPEEN